MSNFNKPKSVVIGGKGITKKIEIGGDAPVSIQTMWKTPLLGSNLDAIAKEIFSLQQLGCDIVRFAVPDILSAEALIFLSKITTCPLVADIHFDHSLALRCMDGNVAKIRINPGNIGSKQNIQTVVKKALDTDTALRIGVNSGSLPKDLQEKITNDIKNGDNPGDCRSLALQEAASREVMLFHEFGFSTPIVSMKASSVYETVQCNKLFAEKYDLPLHLGVTEAGPLISGIVKSTIAFTTLLNENIGSTIRVSLSDTSENEILAARSILEEANKRIGGVRIVSCPRCGRNGFDVHSFITRWQNDLLSLDKNITVAVMGCVVNGPGEGKHADIGITGAGNSVIIFRHGEIVRTVSLEDGILSADTAFREELLKV